MPDDTTDHANLRELIIGQFMLHEVQHHALQADPAQKPVVPLAHGLVDIYKCLHQGEFGVGHTIDHPEGFKQRLYQEVMRNSDSFEVKEPAVENVSGDGMLLRLNLRCLRHCFVDQVADAVEAVTRVCIESAQITRGSSARFFETLDLFKTINQAGEIVLAGHTFAFPTAVVDRFFFEMRGLMRRIGQVPVFSHSDDYRRLNRPSYRVVERSVLQASSLAVLLEG